MSDVSSPSVFGKALCLAPLKLKHLNLSPSPPSLESPVFSAVVASLAKAKGRFLGHQRNPNHAAQPFRATKACPILWHQPFGGSTFWIVWGPVGLFHAKQTYIPTTRVQPLRLDSLSQVSLNSGVLKATGKRHAKTICPTPLHSVSRGSPAASGIGTRSAVSAFRFLQKAASQHRIAKRVDIPLHDQVKHFHFVNCVAPLQGFFGEPNLPRLRLLTVTMPMGIVLLSCHFLHVPAGDCALTLLNRLRQEDTAGNSSVARCSDCLRELWNTMEHLLYIYYRYLPIMPASQLSRLPTVVSIGGQVNLLLGKNRGYKHLSVSLLPQLSHALTLAASLEPSASTMLGKCCTSLTCQPGLGQLEIAGDEYTEYGAKEQ